MIRNIILDLDNTILHSIEQRFVKEEWLTKYENIQITDYVVFLRPHVKPFLTYIFNKYKVGIFTAASSDYATEIVNLLIKPFGGEPIFVLTNQNFLNCQFEFGGHKNIEYLIHYYPEWIHLDDTIIIDDSIAVKRTNDTLCWQIKEFKIFQDLPKDYIGRLSVTHAVIMEHKILEDNELTYILKHL